MKRRKIRISPRSFLLVLMLAAFIGGLFYFVIQYGVHADEWTLFPTNRHIYAKGEIVRAGEITDRNGVVLARTANGERVFNADEDIRRATLHAVGDLSGFISTGLHTAFREKLVGYNLVNGVYSYDESGNDVRLTLDSEVCAEAYRQLKGYSGTIGVYNYQTGEIICMVSTPGFDVNVGYSGGDDEGVYMNRFVSSLYTPGSTFKIVTAAAAVGTFSDAYTREYECGGGTMINGEWIACTGNHGKITLKDAFAQSCNSYFTQLTVDLGKETLDEYAEKLGFNGSFELEGIKAAMSSYDVDRASTIDFAWSGMGQYTDLFNPLQYMTAMGAIANGGTAVEPYYIESINNMFGVNIYGGGGKKRKMLDSEVADAVAGLMDYAVEKKYKKEKFGGINVCAKTGTAEVGKNLVPHSVFVGFVDDDALPLAFVAIVENGGSGNVKALNSASAVLQKARDTLS